MEKLTYEIREVMRESARALVEIMILENKPFRIVLWNDDNWNKPLPKRIMDAFPIQIVLDIKDAALDNSYIDESTGEIILVTVFDEEEYSKVLEYDEIIAVLDLDGQPYILNNFVKEKPLTIENIASSFIPQTKAEVIEMVISDGIPKEDAERSINAFIRNNPDIAKRLGEKV